MENIAIGDNAVWMRCDRLANEGLRSFVIRVDPETLAAVEHEISSEEAFFAVGNEIWFCPTRHEPTIQYLTRRTAKGKSKREIVRCLKRYVAREVYRTLVDDRAQSTIRSPRHPQSRAWV